MSFGVSLGDVLLCSKLALSAYSSLKDAPKEFEGLRLEVLSLNATLRALAEEADSPNSIILLAALSCVYQRIRRPRSYQEMGTRSPSL